MSETNYTPDERFWSKVDVRGPDECWEWKAGRHIDGYGNFWLNGTNVGAHRIAFGLDKIPQGMFVLHSCDNPPCTNPAHLRIGTNEDNMKDMAERGRSPVGSKHGCAKLTEKDVIKIRKLLGSIPQQEIAEMFGVRQVAISRIKTGVLWTHI